MGRKVKCRECGAKLEKENAYLVETISEKTLKINSKYYCNQKCYENQIRRQDLILKCNDIMEEILEIPIRTNIYFNKMYSPIIQSYSYEVIHEFLICEQDYITTMLQGKDFNTNNVKIKYFLAVMQNNIDKYKNVNTNNKFKFKIDTESMFVENKIVNNIKSKQSIEDMLDNL